MNHDFYGAKKGGGGGSGRIEVAPDNLRSTDSMEVLLGLCEGPIDGLVYGARSFYLNETPLENETGELNFNGAQLVVYKGEPVQGPIAPILGGAARSRNVNVQLKYGVPVVRRIVGGRVDFIDVRLVVNSLHNPNYPEKDKSQAVIKVEYKEPQHTEWHFSFEVSIVGKTTTSPFVREARFPVFTDASGQTRPNELEIRVTLLTEDSKEVTTNIVWESFQEITKYPERGYENTAVAHFFATASNQFTSLPELSGLYKCLKIQVPTNYDPVNKTYSGVWDGTFKTAWTDNPAWVLYDFIMNDRYGLNKFGPIVLDKWDTYVAAQWCDELVPKAIASIDGTVTFNNEAKEPRFTFNGVLDQARPAWDWVRYLAGVFLGVLYDDLNGVLRLKVPLRDDPVAAFSNETVSEGLFTYGFTDINTRANDITVAFVNPALDWLEDRRRVVDGAGIEAFGQIPLEIDAPGCIYESEAVRRAWYRIQMAKAQKTTVSFQTNRRAAHLRPYDCIEIADAHINDYQSSRVVERLSGNRVRLSQAVPLPPGAAVRYNVPGVGLSGSIPVIDFPAPPVGGERVVAATHPAWTTAELGSFNEALMRHAVWAASGDVTPNVLHTFTWEIYVPRTQTYHVDIVGDNAATMYLDGVQIASGSYPNIGSFDVPMTEGAHIITIEAFNSSSPTDPDYSRNPAGVAATIEGIWTTRSPQVRAPQEILTLGGLIPDTGEEFPAILVGFDVDGWLTRWLVTKVTEVDGNPDQLQVEAIEDWTSTVIERLDGPTGWTPPVEEPTLPPPSSRPGPIAGCPAFVFNSLGQIEVSGEAGPLKVLSRPAAGGDWVERQTSGNRIIGHPSGPFVFKVLRIGGTGLSSDPALTAECPFTVPACPALVGTVNPVSLALVDASDCNGYDVLVSWDHNFDVGNPFFKEWRVALHRTDTDAIVAEQRLPGSATGAVFIRALLGTPAARYRARVWAVNTCGQEFAPGVAERDYRLCIQQPCTEWDRPIFKGATERVKVISNATGNITLNAAEANNFVLVLSGNVVLTPTGGCAEGVPIKVVTVQPAAGGRTVAFSGTKWRLRKAIPATTAGNAIDKYVLFQYPSPVGWLVADAGRNFGVP